MAQNKSITLGGFLAGIILALLAGGLIVYLYDKNSASKNLVDVKDIKAFDYVKFAAAAPPSHEVDIDNLGADQWVKNYRNVYGKDADFAFNVTMEDVTKFTKSAGTGKDEGLRLYLALKDSTLPNDVTLVLTGYKTVGNIDNDVYIQKDGKKYAVDDMTRCPPYSNCPYDKKDGIGLGHD